MKKLVFSYYNTPNKPEFFFCKYTEDNQIKWSGWCDTIPEAKRIFLYNHELDSTDGYKSIEDFLKQCNHKYQVTFIITSVNDIPNSLDEVIEKFPEYFI